MSDLEALMKQCRALGATLVPMGDGLRVQAPYPLPDDLVLALKEAKPKILAELQQQHADQSIPWMLKEWRRISIPAWRRILMESIVSNDVKREEYARWMLSEVLKDDEYQEIDR